MSNPTDNTQPDHIVDMHEMVTDTNQASEDIYNILFEAVEDAAYTQEWARDEILAIIRTEKLKLLAEVRERVVGEDELYATDEAGWGVFDINRERMYANKVKSDQRAALTKLEAEL